MRILVLDTIHGGKQISRAFSARGDTVDLVDVYRGETAVDVKTALSRTYDLIVAPVHLDPDNPLLRHAEAPVISHHEAVRQLLGDDIPKPMIEITGARGKTTTAHALASLLPGKGILHTSNGTFRFPEKSWISRSSITPGSVLEVVRLAKEIHGWLIVEESLGVTGAGTLAILTSNEDYSFASGKKTAVKAKLASAKHCRHLLLAENIRAGFQDGVVHIEDIASCDGTECTLTFDGKTLRFSSPLLALPAYNEPIMLAAAAALMLGEDPSPLSSFAALTGRMSVSYEQDLVVVDNANSGTNVATTIDAARYARSTAASEDMTLVIGQQEGDGAVCDGFAQDQVLAAIEAIRAQRLIWVGRLPKPGTDEYNRLAPLLTAHARTLDEGYSLARKKTVRGSIVLAVKMWR